MKNAKSGKESRVDELYSRIEALEQMALMTFDMANKTRHIMTRIEGYENAHDKYQADSDALKKPQELNIEIENAEDNSDRT